MAWRDPGLRAELAQAHERLGASGSSHDSLRALAEGAPCIITGQQPAVLGGPLYCVYKIAGAVALARALSRQRDRKIVPVYWCGADDSDFHEARTSWIWTPSHKPARIELPRSLERPGGMVGALPGEDIAAVERSARTQMGNAPGAARLDALLSTLEPCWDLGERVCALYLRMFADDGLVCVDARSGRLRALGQDLFARYASRHADIARALQTRAREFDEARLEIPLNEAALRSGLFVLEDGRRRKLEPDEFDAAIRGGAALSPSVLLRPLLQDLLLAPSAAVLGPSELAYHAQLAPAYELLEVTAAAPMPRPHLTLVPAALPLPGTDEERRALLSGGDDAREILGQLALPNAWRSADSRLQKDVESALRAFSYALGPAAHAKALIKGRDRAIAEVARLSRALVPAALESRSREDRSWEWAPSWLGPRGAPQERAFASVVAAWWWGEETNSELRELGTAYVEALRTGIPPSFVRRLPEEASAR